MQSNKKDQQQHVKSANKQIFTFKEFTSTIEQNPFHDQSLFFDKKNLFNIIHPPRKINSIYEKIIISNRSDPLHPSSYRRYQSLKTRRTTNNKAHLIQDRFCPLAKRFALDNYQAINSKVQYSTNRSIMFDQDRAEINKKQFFKNLLMKFRQNVDNQNTINYHQKISLFKKIFEHYKIKPEQKQHFTMLFQQMQQKHAMDLKADKKISSKITLASRRLNHTSQQHRSIQSPQTKPRKSDIRKHPLSSMIKIQSQRKRQLTQRAEDKSDLLGIVKECQEDNKHVAKIVVSSQNRYRTVEKRMHPLMQPIPFKTQTPVDIKLQKFREFLFAVNYGNHLFVHLEVDKYPATFKVFIGKGNNSNLIRAIFKKRFWFQITKNIKQANFVWTQIKQDSVFKSQTSKYYILPQEVSQPQIKQSFEQETTTDRSVILKDAQNSQIQTKSAQIIVIDKQRSIELKGRQKFKIKKQLSKHLTIDNESNAQLSESVDHKGTSIQQKSLKFKRYNPIINLKTLKSLQNPLCRILPPSQTTSLQTLLTNAPSFRPKPIPFKQRKALILSTPNGSYIGDEDKQKMIVHNHLPVNGILGNKKAMFYILREYMQLVGGQVFEIVPLTFHIKAGVRDEEYSRFLEAYQFRRKRKITNYWVMKPGEFSNRGNGIQCTNKLQQIKKRVQTCVNIKQIDPSKASPRKSLNRSSKSVILQSYITNPLLYNGRKFDIRTYMMTTIVNGKIKAYWYEEGYIRTSSYNWTLADIQDRQIHLTNDAVQKYADSYGKYEPGNKLSYRDIQRYLQATQKVPKNMFYDKIVPQMTEIAAQCLKASYLFLDSDKLQNNFQIFGFDFMLDSKLKPWLIQINTNPCLQLGCPLLQRLIPNMLQNALRLSIDPLFPPPSTFSSNYKYNIAENAINYNKFGLIFDEDRDGPRIRKIYQNVDLQEILTRIEDIQEDKEVFQEDGEEIELQNIDA